MLITNLILLSLLLAIVVFVGKEYETRYPFYADYLNNDKKSTWIQQIRAGTFVLLDSSTDIIYPGSRDKAIAYRKHKQVLTQEPNTRPAE